MSELPESFIEAMQEQEFKHKQMSVTEADYKAAVERLVQVAHTDTSNAYPVAQVLLSLYNGHDYHVDLCDLCTLDYDNLDAVFIAIRGRIFVSTEPHEVIDDGDAVFRRLAEDWQHLHVAKRYAKKYE